MSPMAVVLGEIPFKMMLALAVLILRSACFTSVCYGGDGGGCRRGGGGGWEGVGGSVILITTVRFKSVVNFMLIFPPPSLPSFLPPSHNALWWVPGPPDVPACLHSGPRLMWQRAWLGSAMAIKMNERSVKWQLCYDVTARTWWMVSDAFILASSLVINGILAS